MVPAQTMPEHAESISSSSPKQSGSDLTLDQNRLPSRPVDVTLSIAQTSPATFPSVLHPEGLWFQGVCLLVLLVVLFLSGGRHDDLRHRPTVIRRDGGTGASLALKALAFQTIRKFLAG